MATPQQPSSNYCGYILFSASGDLATLDSVTTTKSGSSAPVSPMAVDTAATSTQNNDSISSVSNNTATGVPSSSTDVTQSALAAAATEVSSAVQQDTPISVDFDIDDTLASSLVLKDKTPLQTLLSLKDALTTGITIGGIHSVFTSIEAAQDALLCALCNAVYPSFEEIHMDGEIQFRNLPPPPPSEVTITSASTSEAPTKDSQEYTETKTVVSDVPSSTEASAPATSVETSTEIQAVVENSSETKSKATLETPVETTSTTLTETPAGPSVETTDVVSPSKVSPPINENTRVIFVKLSTSECALLQCAAGFKVVEVSYVYGKVGYMLSFVLSRKKIRVERIMAVYVWRPVLLNAIGVQSARGPVFYKSKTMGASTSSSSSEISMQPSSAPPIAPPAPEGSLREFLRGSHMSATRLNYAPLDNESDMSSSVDPTNSMYSPYALASGVKGRVMVSSSSASTAGYTLKAPPPPQLATLMRDLQSRNYRPNPDVERAIFAARRPITTERSPLADEFLAAVASKRQSETRAVSPRTATVQRRSQESIAKATTPTRQRSFKGRHM